MFLSVTEKWVIYYDNCNLCTIFFSYNSNLMALFALGFLSQLSTKIVESKFLSNLSIHYVIFKTDQYKHTFAQYLKVTASFLSLSSSFRYIAKYWLVWQASSFPTVIWHWRVPQGEVNSTEGTLARKSLLTLENISEIVKKSK